MIYTERAMPISGKVVLTGTISYGYHSTAGGHSGYARSAYNPNSDILVEEVGGHVGSGTQNGKKNKYNFLDFTFSNSCKRKMLLMWGGAERITTGGSPLVCVLEKNGEKIFEASLLNDENGYKILDIDITAGDTITVWNGAWYRTAACTIIIF